MKAVILAGGKGTRMGEFTREIPKPMLEIGGIPILQHQLNLLKKYDITEVIVLVNYLKDTIIQNFGDGSSQNISITYFEEREPLGTVGGIKEIEDQLTDDFLVLYGDVMINMHLGLFIDHHRKKGSECTLALHPNDHPHDSDLVEMDNEGRITQFYPKPHNPEVYYPNMVNAGAYIFSPVILPLLEKGVKADFGREVFPRICRQIRMYGYNTAEYLKDMGTPERWEEVEIDWQSGKTDRVSYEHKQKAIFLDRDGVLNEEISFISKPEDLKLYDFTPDAIRRINESDYKAIVVTNQSVIARNLCTWEELKVIHNKLDTELAQHSARLDALYLCPHHPDRGFPEERTEYKIDCLCRKPKPGMLLDAAHAFNLDLSGSYIIGDNDRDIQAGVNAGCSTVGVRTGYGLRKSTVNPDLFFEDLAEAVNYILNEPHRWVWDKIKEAEFKLPCVILIGGNARSGKSTLATYLKKKYEQENASVLKIELDNWILPEDQRRNCKTVHDRFRLDQLEADIQQVLTGIDLDMETYANHPMRKPQPINYRYNGEDIVLIEGVVALSSEILQNISHYKIFVETSPEEHKKRINNYYRWRGKSQHEIDTLYQQRLEDEYQLIEKDRILANLVVNK